mmetsp:Transcript_913/g.1747  ORF Transcript_913/g.1747 Transcript_913/m.1747 type:complete len:230 (-) Transcript_913:79-768(-)
MRPVLCRPVQIRDHVACWHGKALHRGSGEVRVQGVFGFRPAEHPIGGRAGHRHAHALGEFRHEDADQREARGGLHEFLVVRRLWHRKAHFGDDLAILERGLEHALEVIIRRDLAFVGDDRRARGQSRRRITGGGVVVGERATDGASVAHRRIADPRRQRRQSRIAAVRRNRAMGRGPADAELVTFVTDPDHLGNAVQADQSLHLRQPCFHGGEQRLPPTQRLRLLLRER